MEQSIILSQGIKHKIQIIVWSTLSILNNFFRLLSKSLVCLKFEQIFISFIGNAFAYAKRVVSRRKKYSPSIMLV